MKIMKKSRFVKVALSVFAGLLLFASGACCAEFSMKVGYVVPESYPHHIAARDVLKPYIEKESGGRILVELYPNGQLGQDRQLCESLQLGAVEMAFPSTTVLAGFVPQSQLMDLPYLFETKEQARAAWDGPVGGRIRELAQAQGLRILGFGDIGFLQITNNVKSIEKLADLAGLKIRVQENPVSIATAKALGMNPSTMTFGEVYTALQQKVVDAQEQCINVVRNMRFNEVQSYLSLTGEAFSSIAVIVGEDFFNSLPSDLQEVVQEGVRCFCVEQRRICEEQETANLKELKEKGMAVNELSSEERKHFVEATEEVRRTFGEKVDPELYQKLMDMRK